MSSTKRLWVAVLYTLLAVIVLVQAYDAWQWARTPWMGFTLLAGGRVVEIEAELHRDDFTSNPRLAS